MRTRAEHLAWCKERALEYVDRGQLVDAVTSMASDMQKHEETKLDDTAAAFLMMAGAMDASSGNTQGVRRWIEGFN